MPCWPSRRHGPSRDRPHEGVRLARPPQSGEDAAHDVVTARGLATDMSSDDIFERSDADSTSGADARDEVAPLPPYTVRTSTRTRRLHLRVSPLGRVEVVVPRRV